MKRLAAMILLLKKTHLDVSQLFRTKFSITANIHCSKLLHSSRSEGFLNHRLHEFEGHAVISWENSLRHVKNESRFTHKNSLLSQMVMDDVRQKCWGFYDKDV